MTRLLNTPIIGRNAAPVASSCSDMLAGLSKNEILRMPPAFWAKAASAQHAAISSPPAIARLHFPIIPSSRCLSRKIRRSSLLLLGLLLEPDLLDAPIVVDAVDRDCHLSSGDRMISL